MSFEIDDSNPENPLAFNSPSDFGMETWTDLFIHYSRQLDTEICDEEVLNEVLETVRITVHVILAYLMDQTLRQNPEGGDK